MLLLLAYLLCVDGFFFPENSANAPVPAAEKVEASGQSGGTSEFSEEHVPLGGAFLNLSSIGAPQAEDVKSVNQSNATLEIPERPVPPGASFDLANIGGLKQNDAPFKEIVNDEKKPGSNGELEEKDLLFNFKTDFL